MFSRGGVWQEWFYSFHKWVGLVIHMKDIKWSMFNNFGLCEMDISQQHGGMIHITMYKKLVLVHTIRITCASDRHI